MKQHKELCKGCKLCGKKKNVDYKKPPRIRNLPMLERLEVLKLSFIGEREDGS